MFNHNLKEDYNVGSILTIFFAVITGVFGFSSLGPVMKTVQEAKVAMASILDLLAHGS